MTEHPDGSVTVTTVTRDSPWTNDERDFVLAAYDLVCPACGNLRSACSDPEKLWYPQRSVCYATAAKDLTSRRLREKRKDSGPTTTSLHPSDGETVWVSDLDLTPDDDFV